MLPSHRIKYCSRRAGYSLHRFDTYRDLITLIFEHMLNLHTFNSPANIEYFINRKMHCTTRSEITHHFKGIVSLLF
jgi:hypothetical protein